MKRASTVLTLLALLFVLTWVGYGQRQSQRKTSWEYLTVSAWDAKSRKATDLNELGAQGWELVSVHNRDSSNDTFFYLKRAR